MKLSKRQWAKTRQRILIRDNYTCQMCGAVLTSGRSDPRAAEVDHIIPQSQGGGDEDDNLQALCKRCNGGVKQGDDRRGYSEEVGIDGWMVDERHPSSR